MRKIGLCFTGQPYPIRRMVAAAQQAEHSGYDSVWVAEDTWTGRDAIVPLSCVALNTQRVRIGTCLIGATTRHPVLTVMTVSALSELAPGRVVLGVGLASGWQPPFGDAAVSVAPPLATMRTVVEGLRALLTGSEVPWGDGARGLMIPRPWFSGAVPPVSGGMPIYVGAVRPKMTELAGEIGDGLLLEMECLRQEMPARLERFHAGAARAGRDPKSLEVVKLVLTSVTEKGPLEPNALGWATKSVALLDDEAVARLGWDVERVRRIRAAWTAQDWEAGKRLMTPEMTRAFVAAGTREHCMEVIEETAGLGVTPVLIPYGGALEPVLELGAEYARG